MNQVLDVTRVGNEVESVGISPTQSVGNIKHQLIARFADAYLPIETLKEWLKEQRCLDPALVLFAQFEEGRFSNERLEALLIVGFDSYLVGIPSPTLVSRLCQPINGSLVRVSERFGHLYLKGDFLHRGAKKVKFSKKELVLVRALMAARSNPLSEEELRIVHGVPPTAVSHTVGTHIFRLKVKLKGLDMHHAIEYQKNKGYYLVL